jgi:hypothetical protein
MNGYGQRILLAVVIGTLLAMAAPVGAQQAQSDEQNEHPRRGEGRRARNEDRSNEPGQVQAPQARDEAPERRPEPRPAVVERAQRAQPQWQRGPEPAESGRRWQQAERQERDTRRDEAWSQRMAQEAEREQRDEAERVRNAQAQERARDQRDRALSQQRESEAREQQARQRRAAPEPGREFEARRTREDDRPQPGQVRENDQQRGPAWRDLDRVAQERRDIDERRTADRDERERRQDARRDGVGPRLPAPQQRRLIESQQRQAEAYRHSQADRERVAEQYSRTLRDQRRTSQYRYQNDYIRRVRDHHHRYSTRRWDYYNDPFFYTPVSYRYYFSGYHYDTNRYGADLLRDAVRRGYEEGYWAGRADRMDGWRPDYRSSYAYSDASYGYYGYYVPYDAYRYYFRQGFRRGYDDGYYGAYRYGTYRRGTPSILPAILATILVLDALD